MVVVYLVVASIHNFSPVASRVIHWASTWNRPVLSAVVMVCLAWTWHGQSQRVWASACTLVHRHALRPHPATHLSLSGGARAGRMAIATMPLAKCNFVHLGY